MTREQNQWLRPYLRRYCGRFALIIFLGMLTVLCASALMFTSGFLISKSAARPENILMVYVPIVLVRTFGIGRAVVHYVERLVGHDAVLRILSKMRVRLYRILEPQALFIRSRFRTGDVLGVLADDIEHLQNVYVRTIFPSIVAIVMYAAGIAALGWFDLPFALLMALYIAVLVFILPWISLWFTRRKHRLMKQERSGLYRKLTDAVLGMSDWVISGRASQFVDSYEADEARVARIDRDLRIWARWRTLIAQSVVGLTVITMVYWAGSQAADGNMPAVMIAAFGLVVFPLMDAFLPVSEAVEKLPQYEDSLERLSGMGEAPVEQAVGSAANVKPELLQQARESTHIRLDQVSFRHAGSASLTINGVSLDIPQGKKIALIGRSGAGKSTLSTLIQGAVVPESGSVMINNVRADEYGEHIPEILSVLNQRPHLFDTTVANNIRLGRRSASDEEIRQVAEQVKLNTLIASLPKGYDTAMMETGQRFSGGERQRIALARVLLQRTPVVILDEPTVGLDPKTELELLATMFETMKGKSLIWITHHLVGVEQMDEIVFVENGQVEMRGSHAELMKQYPRYRNLYHLDRPGKGLMQSS
ncbi:thiol reductant ABC exporter subunit CydC [Paenibacillus alvei]|uniref:ABC membrane transporter (ATP-binding protein) required for cytochrome bb' function (Reductant efflux pump) n=1 Tax=Paenibacillus alvei TaxID=44250 RepID=A0A383RK94_PAEAL|nr:thiol reductant ABC exporter subunit CydC [Paenibacillus alvei]SYX86716.1 ABC membrane transporter (ATP-binding protein) required for cytochrome bb' function (reductant efflux pump) [Paenibacillus alvei]